MEKILDMICAKYGNEIIEGIDAPQDRSKIEAAITKSLGVLQEDGVYAFALYTQSKRGNSSTEKKTAKLILDKSFNLLKDKDIGLLVRNSTDFLGSIRTALANDIDRLLFAKELLERTLVYARYHAKALGKSESEEETEEGAT